MVIPAALKLRFKKQTKKQICHLSLAAFGFVEHQNVGHKHLVLGLYSAIGVYFTRLWNSCHTNPTELWWAELPKQKAGFPSYRWQTPSVTRRWRERGSAARHGASAGLLEKILLCPEKLKKKKLVCNWGLQEMYLRFVWYILHGCINGRLFVKSFVFWLIFSILLFCVCRRNSPKVLWQIIFSPS